MADFNIGDWVYASDWCYGQIVDIDMKHDTAVVEFDIDSGGGSMSFGYDELQPADPPTKLETLPQYHFDRDKMCKAFDEVFTTDEFVDICVECSANRHLESFSLFWHSDEFYILHRPSGIMINWYKHLGRTNTCNMWDFTLDDLREFLEKLREDLVWAGIIKDDILKEKLRREFYEED